MSDGLLIFAHVPQPSCGLQPSLALFCGALLFVCSGNAAKLVPAAGTGISPTSNALGGFVGNKCALALKMNPEGDPNDANRDDDQAD